MGAISSVVSSRADLAVVARAALLLPMVRRRLRSGSYRDVRAWLDARSPAPTGTPPAPARARRIGQLVNGVARRPLLRATCLPRSLVTWHLLAREGIESSIEFGVRTDDGVVRFHAWVVSDGVVVNDGADVRSRYLSFDGAAPPVGAVPTD